MHPPLNRPHPLCHEVVDLLVACHEDNPYAKFMGSCNQAKTDVDQCFKIEKEVKRKKNLAKAREFDAFWKEQNKNGPGFTIPDVRLQNKEEN